MPVLERETNTMIFADGSAFFSSLAIADVRIVSPIADNERIPMVSLRAGNLRLVLNNPRTYKSGIPIQKSTNRFERLPRCDFKDHPSPKWLGFRNVPGKRQHHPEMNWLF
jgi:hypothetical protein